MRTKLVFLSTLLISGCSSTDDENIRSQPPMVDEKSQPAVVEQPPAQVEQPPKPVIEVKTDDNGLEITAFDPNAQVLPDEPEFPAANAGNVSDPSIMEVTPAMGEIIPDSANREPLFPEMTEPVMTPGSGIVIAQSPQTMIAELARRRAEKGGNTIENSKALLALYLAIGVGTNEGYALAAGDLIQNLRVQPDFMAHDWLKLQEAEYNRQINETGQWAQRLKESYLDAIKHVPMEVSMLYFTTADKTETDEQGMYVMRMMTHPNGQRQEDATVHPGETANIAFKLRYCAFSRINELGKYLYSVKVVPSLADEQGQIAPGFNSTPREYKNVPWGDPEEYIPGRCEFPLPKDIKAGHYTLTLAFYDLNRTEPEKSPVTRMITVKVLN